jgi:hypothetical protein
MLIPIFHVTVRRDANTITPVTVPDYEVAMLQTVFGEDNIVKGDQAGVFESRADEFDRLAHKYGVNTEGELVVESVFGKKAAGGLEAAIERSAARVAKEAGKKPAAGKE